MLLCIIGIHPKYFSDMSIEVFKITTIHKSMIVCRTEFICSCSYCDIYKSIYFFFAIELDCIEDFTGFFAIGYVFVWKKCFSKGMCQKHHMNSIVKCHAACIFVGKLHVLSKTNCFVEVCCFWKIFNWNVYEDFVGHCFIWK